MGHTTFSHPTLKSIVPLSQLVMVVTIAKNRILKMMGSWLKFPEIFYQLHQNLQEIGTYLPSLSQPLTSYTAFKLIHWLATVIT